MLRVDHVGSQVRGVVHLLMQDRKDVDGVRTGDVEDRVLADLVAPTPLSALVPWTAPVRPIDSCARLRTSPLSASSPAGPRYLLADAIRS